MIKFFRRIRQRLLSENRFSKYLIYAIGEIILVVIGILIALQINNWNQNRLQVKEEQKILENLKIDFDNNKKLLDNVIETTKSGISNSLEMLNYTGNKKKPETSKKFDSILNDIFISPAYRPVIGALHEITNSGKLGIIDNRELRKLLATWPAIVEVVKVQYETAEANEMLLNQFILKQGNWLNADQVSTTQRNVTFPKSGFESDNRDLLASQYFENLIENVAIGLDNYLSRLNEANTLLTRIEELIELEIEHD